MSGWRCCEDHPFQYPGCEACAEVQAAADAMCAEVGHDPVLMPWGDENRFTWSGLAPRCHRCGRWMGRTLNKSGGAPKPNPLDRVKLPTMEKR